MHKVDITARNQAVLTLTNTITAARSIVNLAEGSLLFSQREADALRLALADVLDTLPAETTEMYLNPRSTR